jgi:NTP pyrophosphatase (non-canonical NTP hydrolase)
MREGRPMSGMTIAEFQRLIEAIYYKRDHARGVPGTFMWFTEEVGELARALKRGDRENLAHEFADVFAWMATLASLSGIELSEAIAKYAKGCPRCRGTPCSCH